MTGFYGGYMGNAGALENISNLTANQGFGIPETKSPVNVPYLPFATNPTGGIPMGNAGFFSGSQIEQTVPPGFQNKMVS